AIENKSLNLDWMKKDDDPNLNRILDQIMAGKTILDSPPYMLEVANSKRCNLNCIMCKPVIPQDDDVISEKLFTQIIPEYLPGLSRIFLTTHGETFFNPYTRKFLQSLDAKRFPSLQIQLLTNGTMFTPELWESISHNHYESIYVSIDAASKDTYERIRHNGNWDILRRNLDLISELRGRNIFKDFRISFIVMRSNYKEMKDFVELGITLGCDQIIFQKISGLAEPEENITFNKDKKVLAEIAALLADPVFSRPGVNTTLIDDYRRYAGKAGFLQDNILIRLKRRLVYSLIRTYWRLPFSTLIFGLPRKKELRWKIRLGAHG
ncbi:MAG TPA: radical SAM protein, partial [Bacillota bacterium]|nr:radical SAM protein [Bacillota bacterium]